MRLVQKGLVLGVACVVLIGADMLAQEKTAQEKAARNVSLQEIVVTASRREMPLADTPDVIQVIDRKAIEEMKPSKTGDLFEYSTGASVETGTGVGLPNRSVVSINGLPANYTLVLVDGVRLLSEHIHTGQNVESIPLQAIERIEVMRGAASAQYGSGAIGGIVNIVTRKCKDKPEFSVNLGGGSYNTYEGGYALLMPAGDSVRISSFANWEESDGVPLKLPTSRAGHVAYSRLSLLNRVDADLGKDTDVFGSVNYVANTMDFNKGTSTEPRWGTADMILVTPVLGFTHAVSPSLDMAGQVAYSDWDNEASAEKNIFLTPEARAIWKMDKSQTLMAGGDFTRNEFERSKVPSHEQDAYGAYVQHEWAAGDDFSTMAAMRYDKVDGVDAAYSPKLSMMYAPVEAARARVSVGRGFHAPTVQELYEEGFGHSGRAYRFGNPELEPEYSTTYTMGLELQPVQPVEIFLNGYYSDIDDMIVPVYEGPWAQNPDVDVWRRTNIENAEVYGAEAALHWTIASGLGLETGYTWTDSKDKDTGRQLSYRPGSSVYGKLALSHAVSGDLTLMGFVGVKAGFDRAAWNWKPATGAATDNPDGLTTELANYTKLDAGISAVIAKNCEVFVKVENILGEDIEYLDDAFTVIDGEPVYRAGVKYDFIAAK